MNSTTVFTPMFQNNMYKPPCFYIVQKNKLGQNTFEHYINKNWVCVYVYIHVYTPCAFEYLHSTMYT